MKISLGCLTPEHNCVASFAEAWIENNIMAQERLRIGIVASFAEAWIEKMDNAQKYADLMGRLLRGGVD